jgi:hypothetical protein
VQNPTSIERIRLLGERLHLTESATVLDIASGHAGPATQLARSIWLSSDLRRTGGEFHEAAQRRVEVAGLTNLIELVRIDALDPCSINGGWT